MSMRGMGFTLWDAVALGQASGPGTRLALGPTADADIIAPAGLTLTPQEARGALTPASRYFFSFGNQAVFPDIEPLALALDEITEHSGTGFMLACVAEPGLGRFVYQGHLFQDGQLIADLRRTLTPHLSGRPMIIPYEAVEAGGTVLARRISATREQGASLALLDAVDEAQCAALAPVLAAQLCTGGPAWAANLAPPLALPEPPGGRVAILSGALDRQTLFQLATAREKLPLRQIDPQAPDIEGALTWAAAQERNFIISTSAPPDMRGPATTLAADALAEIAASLAAQNLRHFAITGNDTASIILHRLGTRMLTVGGEWEELPWLSSGDYKFLLKPGGFGGQHLLLDGFGPQIRLNDAAE
ncbi:MAG TPA: nucleotide-binding domain containing protein [Acidocella sp.]|nr:nucleotide-binding domain containing protein [Acidocella sp.]